jgi:hemerythrin-like domain-containing protein
MPPMRAAAIEVIRSEHRSLVAVIHALEYLAERVGEPGPPPDFRLLNAILYYVREYPERLHHPAEDRELFARVRARTTEANALLAALEEEHARGEARLHALTTALNRLEAGALGSTAAFKEAVQVFADGYFAHMRREERELLPIAERVLADEDWAAIHRTFAAHSDPGFEDGAGGEFERLFQRIGTLSPPPPVDQGD